MGIAKVTLNNETLMDITDDTVTASGLMLGDTAHGANGESVTGTYEPVTYDVATETTDGLMSASDKVKLNGVATGAEVNQNAFSNVKVGTTTIEADSKTDTLTLTAGTNITLTPNATSDSVTIAVNGMPSKVSDLDNDSGFITSSGTASNVSGTVAIEHGGTGATSASTARTNLGLGSAATYDVETTVADDAKLPTGAAVKSFVEGKGYLTTDNDTYTSAMCETAGSTAAKTATCTNFSLRDNCVVPIIFKNSNTAQSALTLNINNTGAKPISINGEASSATNYTLPAGAYLIRYVTSDGSNRWGIRTDDFIPVNISGGVMAYVDSRDADRRIWFSQSYFDYLRSYDDDFKYNPSTKTLTVNNVNGYVLGNASTYDVANNGTTTSEGSVLDARYGKTLLDLINSISSLLNGFGIYSYTPNEFSAYGSVKDWFDNCKVGINLATVWASSGFTDEPLSDAGYHYVIALKIAAQTTYCPIIWLGLSKSPIAIYVARYNSSGLTWSKITTTTS